MRILLFGVVVTLMSTFSLTLFAVSGHAQNSRKVTVSGSEDPQWTFSAHPYFGEGYRTRPVVVSAIRTTAKSLTVTEARIRNNSSKPVNSVRLAWILTNEKDGKNEVVYSGESQLLPFEKTLAIGETTLLKLPLFSFSEIKDAISAKHALKGRFDAQVFVKDIVFEDETKWTVGEKVEMKKLASV